MSVLTHRFTWLLFAGAFMLGSCGPNAGTPEEDASARPDYVTAAVCATCHERETEAWTGSDHDLAMAHAAPETVLGDFDNITFVHRGDESRFFRAQDRYFVETEGPDGETERFEVKYTFGVRPLQQYLVELPRGRIKALTVAWDTEKEQWFSLHPDEDVPRDDWRHWTGRGMNWNYMCAACHSTGLEKNFDLAADAYETTWSDIDVSCESCHGPGAAHVAWARGYDGDQSRNADERHANGLLVQLDANPRTLIETCAPCHSRRRVLTDDFLPGDHFLDHYMPELIDEDLYFPDGQIKDEVFVYGSFVQSRMYHEGVTCGDCHDPHSTRPKLDGNDLCTQCHAAETFDVPDHLNHPESTAGAECANCHMPERTYMVVDPRRDHSFKVPRPDLTLEIGIPNACNTCHEDRSPGWAKETVEAWYGPARSDSAAYGRIIDAGRRGEPAAEETLISFVASAEMPAILRATSVTLLGAYNTRKALDAVKQALKDRAPLVRAAAVRAVEEAPERELYSAVTPLLSDTVRAVRIEAARVLTHVQGRFPRSSDAPETQAFQSALAEYRESQRVVEDQPEAHLNLAIIHEQLEEWEQAEDRYRTAIRLDSSFVPAHLNLAMLLNRRRDELLQSGRSAQARALFEEIERLLQTVLEYAPGMAEAHYTLGLLLAEDEARLRQAAEHLSEAAQRSPENARIQYNTGLAFQHLGAPTEAERFLLAARRLEPESPDYINALTIFYIQQEKWDAALAYTDTLMAAVPPSPELQRRRAWILDQKVSGAGS